MAFIDWLKKQHVDSLKASQRMAADPYLRGMKPGAMNFPRTTRKGWFDCRGNFTIPKN